MPKTLEDLKEDRDKLTRSEVIDLVDSLYEVLDEFVGDVFNGEKYKLLNSKINTLNSLLTDLEVLATRLK